MGTVLIVLIITNAGYNPTLTMQEFTNEARCVEAQVAALKMASDAKMKASATCVRK